MGSMSIDISYRASPSKARRIVNGLLAGTDGHPLIDKSRITGCWALYEPGPVIAGGAPEPGEIEDQCRMCERTGVDRQWDGREYMSVCCASPTRPVIARVAPAASEIERRGDCGEPYGTAEAHAVCGEPGTQLPTIEQRGHRLRNDGDGVTCVLCGDRRGGLYVQCEGQRRPLRPWALFAPVVNPDSPGAVDWLADQQAAADWHGERRAAGEALGRATTIAGRIVRYGVHLTARDRALIAAALDHGFEPGVALGTVRKSVRWLDAATLQIVDAGRDDYGRRETRQTVVRVGAPVIAGGAPDIAARYADREAAEAAQLALAAAGASLAAIGECGTDGLGCAVCDECEYEGEGEERCSGCGEPYGDGEAHAPCGEPSTQLPEPHAHTPAFLGSYGAGGGSVTMEACGCGRAIRGVNQRTIGAWVWFGWASGAPHSWIEGVAFVTCERCDAEPGTALPCVEAPYRDGSALGAPVIVAPEPEPLTALERLGDARDAYGAHLQGCGRCGAADFRICEQGEALSERVAALKFDAYGARQA